MYEITITKSTIPQTNVEIDLSIATQTITINNHGMYDSLDDNQIS